MRKSIHVVEPRFSKVPGVHNRSVILFMSKVTQHVTSEFVGVGLNYIESQIISLLLDTLSITFHSVEVFMNTLVLL